MCYLVLDRLKRNLYEHGSLRSSRNELNGWQDTRSPPNDLRVDGRPIWEPPILDYRPLTDSEDSVKERDDFIKFYGGDVARGTDAWDAITECYILDRYLR